jgi:hypothetical protein
MHILGNYLNWVLYASNHNQISWMIWVWLISNKNSTNLIDDWLCIIFSMACACENNIDIYNQALSNVMIVQESIPIALQHRKYDSNSVEETPSKYVF